MDLDDVSGEDNCSDISAHVATLRATSFEADTLTRIVDTDAEVVCYHVSERDALACIPLSETELDVEDLPGTD
jgi:hypothetical protein